MEPRAKKRKLHDNDIPSCEEFFEYMKFVLFGCLVKLQPIEAENLALKEKVESPIYDRICSLKCRCKPKFSADLQQFSGLKVEEEEVYLCADVCCGNEPVHSVTQIELSGMKVLYEQSSKNSWTYAEVTSKNKKYYIINSCCGKKPFFSYLLYHFPKNLLFHLHHTENFLSSKQASSLYKMYLALLQEVDDFLVSGDKSFDIHYLFRKFCYYQTDISEFNSSTDNAFVTSALDINNIGDWIWLEKGLSYLYSLLDDFNEDDAIRLLRKYDYNHEKVYSVLSLLDDEESTQSKSDLEEAIVCNEPATEGAEISLPNQNIIFTNPEDIMNDDQTGKDYHSMDFQALRELYKTRNQHKRLPSSKITRDVLINKLVQADKDEESKQSFSRYWKENNEFVRPIFEESQLTYDKPGPTEATKCLKTAKEIFMFFWSELIDPIVESTNQYAKQIYDAKMNEYKKATTIKTAIDFIVTRVYNKKNAPHKEPELFETNREYLICFLGVMVYMGSLQVKCTSDFWDLTDGNLVVRGAMSKKQFLDHLRYFHLPEDNSIPCLKKVNWLLKKLLEKFKQAWNPTIINTVDEAMVATRSPRSGIRSFMPAKPTRWGIKVWMCVDAEGYTVSFDVYLGKKGNGGAVHTDLGPSVVRNFAEQYPPGPYIFIADNFFSSVQLVEELTSKGRYFVGTIRSNRKVVNQIPWKSLNEGEFQYFVSEDGHTAITNWKDSKNVTFITNYIDAKFNNDSYKRRGRTTITLMPPVSPFYRKSMFNVDQEERNRKMFSSNRISHRHWFCLFSFAEDVSILNCWKLFLENNPNLPKGQTSQKAFRKMLGKELIGKGIRQRAPSSPVCPRNIPTYNIKDVPFNHLNILESIPEKKRRVCKCCSQCPNGTKASHVCKVCQRPVQAQPVHLLNHFVAYHNTEEFFNV